MTSELSESSLSALDQALLFISAFLSAVFIGTLTYLSVPIRNGIGTAAPFILLSTILPLYVGYMRGAVERTQYPILERTRGWVYLIFGSGGFLLVLLMQVFPLQPSADLLLTGVIALGIEFLLIAGFFLLTLFVSRFVVWLYAKAAAQLIDDVVRTSLFGTMGALFVSLLSFVSIARFGEGFNQAPIPPGILSTEFTLVITPLFFLPVLFAEFNSHHGRLLEEAVSEYRKRRQKDQIKLESAPLTLMVIVDAGLRSIYLVFAGYFDDKLIPLKAGAIAIGVLVGETITATPGWALLGLSVTGLTVLYPYVGFVMHAKRTWATELASLNTSLTP